MSFADTFAATVSALRRGSALRRAGELLLHSAFTLVAALIGLASLIALVGDDPGTTNRITRFVDAVGPDGGASAIRGTLVTAFANDPVAGLCLLAAIGAMVWFASAYLRSFSGAVPSLDRRVEPRALAKALRALLRVALGTLFAAVALALVLSGRSARAAIEASGGNDHVLALWSAGRWPLIAGAYVVLFLLLHHVFVRPPAEARSVAAGQVIAVTLWVLALAGFALFLATFGSFDQTYESLAATVVSLVWLTLFSVLYYATPSLRIGSFGAILPGLGLSLVAWLALSAGFAVCAAKIDPFSTAYGAIGLAAVALAWLWLSNLAILFGTGLNFEVGRHLEPVPLETEPLAPGAGDSDLEWSVRAALADDTAHRGMWSALPGTPEGVPALLSELECDLNDWGFAYGVAWATARRRYPEEPDQLIAERALEAARTVFGEYCAGVDWSERLADRQLAGSVQSQDRL